MALALGQRLTLLRIDDALAMTHRFELEVRRVLEPQAVGYDKLLQRVVVVRQRGKRKDFYLDLKHDDILLDGWGLPFRTDLEAYSDTPGAVCSGNACYNLVGDPEAIRQAIETRAVLPVTDSAKAKIIVARAPRTTCDASGLQPLYPEIETRHSVVNRIKASA